MAVRPSSVFRSRSCHRQEFGGRIEMFASSDAVVVGRPGDPGQDLALAFP